MKNRLFQKKQAVFGIPGPSYRDGAIQKVHKKCTAMLLKALKTTLGKGCFMASVQENRKNGVVVSYRFVACLGRDAHGKQIRRFKTWTPPKGIGPARAPKEAEKQAALWEQSLREKPTNARTTIDDFTDFIEKIWLPLYVRGNDRKAKTIYMAVEQYIFYPYQNTDPLLNRTSKNGQ